MWCDYFEKRLKKLVIDRSYIRTLGQEELLKIQKTFYAHTSGREDIDENGSSS